MNCAKWCNAYDTGFCPLNSLESPIGYATFSKASKKCPHLKAINHEVLTAEYKEKLTMPEGWGKP